MRGMGSPSAAILFSCVAMSMVAVGSAASNNSSFISMAALESADPASSRKLFGIPMMDQGVCPVRFDQMQHFGRIEATCKGDQVPTSQCCDAFACPYRDELNDLENGCSTEMLIRINTICMLPTSFFVECGNSRQGIDCESVKG
ncbi:GPI-anchored protein LLG1 [Brachypodium distachyon]|uniref:GPI-anchored protein LLG1-like domain-containing protein n=1 Tax=Brachypodium distachyon TaxID=15368 RepID=I1IZB1_BRADI|nr:GPI-anchored protein LLG1 [Brachypodium distachyon]KQJ83390.1 hypothetical protein BRADI_5g14710v3 [Brachypodium distachyon]|eukprot:XP_003580077.1 GPI-anchored protein LLG1 [Brachypodium distachyon]